MTQTLRTQTSADKKLSDLLEVPAILACCVPWGWLGGLYSLALRHRFTTGRWPGPMLRRFPLAPPTPSGVLDPKTFGVHYDVLWVLGSALLPLSLVVLVAFLLAVCAGLRTTRWLGLYFLGLGLLCAQLFLDPFRFFEWYCD